MGLKFGAKRISIFLTYSIHEVNGIFQRFPALGYRGDLRFPLYPAVAIVNIPDLGYSRDFEYSL
jgi:hypothetical protein